MQWNALFWLLTLSCSGFAQTDSSKFNAKADEWNTVNYSQEDKIYNRSVWTFADNPALTGFDRKLNLLYRYEAQNFALGVENDNGKMVLAFQQHHAQIDAAFGGTKKNWGVGAAYSNVKEGLYDYHQILLAHSFRVKIKDHQLLFGYSAGVRIADMDWDYERLVFRDEIDPRYGLVYPTNEVRRFDNKLVTPFHGPGFRYVWKRLAFDYSFQYGPHGAYAYTAVPDLQLKHRLKILYHFKVDQDVTLTPEFVAFNNRQNIWRFSPVVTVTYRDMLYGQLGFLELSRLRLKVGYQFQDRFTVEIASSAYTNPDMVKVAGLATAEIGARYQFNFKKREKE